MNPYQNLNDNKLDSSQAKALVSKQTTKGNESIKDSTQSHANIK